MQIDVIFTGGTIGSKLGEDGYIGNSKEMPFYLLDRFMAYCSNADAGYMVNTLSGENSCPEVEGCFGGEKVTFSTQEPYQILSENLRADYLLTLISCVKNTLARGSKGIIITHGTDTLQYTAAILGFVFADASVPIVLVSSAYVLDDPRANGLSNFAGAVDFITEACSRCDEKNDQMHSQSFGGVYVSYCNEGHNGKEGDVGKAATIHLGVRTLAHMAYSADIYSVGAPIWKNETGEAGSAENTCVSNSQYNCMSILEYNREYKSQSNPEYNCKCNCKYNPESSRKYNCKSNPEYNRKCKSIYADLVKKGTLNLCDTTDEILWLHFNPAMVYPSLSEKNRVVLMETYHSGTLRVDEGLRTFLEDAKQNHIPVYLVGMDAGREQYETVKDFQKLGFKLLPKVSPLAAYCKLWLGISNGLDIEALMDMNIAGEYVE